MKKNSRLFSLVLIVVLCNSFNSNGQNYNKNLNTARLSQQAVEKYFDKEENRIQTNNSILVSNKSLVKSTKAEDLFFSEYIEGSNYNKALEIYNGTGVDIDLHNYTILINSNGGSWYEAFSWPLNTILSNNDVYVLAEVGSDSRILAVADSIILNPYVDGTSNIVSFNGNDARALCKINGTDTTFIDVIGIMNQNPGIGWTVNGISDATFDHTLVRKTEINVGNTDWSVSAGNDTASSEWIVYDIDNMDFIGWHIDNTMEAVIFDPVTYTGELPVGMEIVEEAGQSYLKVTTDGWSNNLDIIDFQTGEYNQVSVELRYEAGISGVSPEDAHSMVFMNSEDGSNLYYVEVYPSPSTFTSFSAATSQNTTVSFIQFAVLNSTTPVFGATMYIGKITLSNKVYEKAIAPITTQIPKADKTITIDGLEDEAYNISTKIIIFQMVMLMA